MDRALIEAQAIAAAIDYLKGSGPWKHTEIGIAADDYLVQCFVKVIADAKAQQIICDADIARQSGIGADGTDIAEEIIGQLSAKK